MSIAERVQSQILEDRQQLLLLIRGSACRRKDEQNMQEACDHIPGRRHLSGTSMWGSAGADASRYRKTYADTRRTGTYIGEESQQPEGADAKKEAKIHISGGNLEGKARGSEILADQICNELQLLGVERAHTQVRLRRQHTAGKCEGRWNRWTGAAETESEIKHG